MRPREIIILAVGVLAAGTSGIFRAYGLSFAWAISLGITAVAIAVLNYCVGVSERAAYARGFSAGRFAEMLHTDRIRREAEEWSSTPIGTDSRPCMFCRGGIARRVG